MAGKFQAHKQKWNNCQLCDLCKTRKHVVLLRGDIPADVLFIGEAPGMSEDVHAKPFYGPAGDLLDSIVADAIIKTSEFKRLTKKPRIAFTNLVACIPRNSDPEDPSKVEEPPDYSIEACEERLQEIVGICKPTLIVMVGKLSAKWVPKLLDAKQFVEIVHPAFILRAKNNPNKPLMIKKAVVDLSNAFMEL